MDIFVILDPDPHENLVEQLDQKLTGQVFSHLGCIKDFFPLLQNMS